MSLIIFAAAQAVAAPVAAVPAPRELAAPATVSAAPALPAGILLAQDTPIELMAPTEVTTDKARAGTRFKLRVNRAVEAGGRVIIPVGTPAYGEVITASDSGGLGKSGKMTARLLYLELGEVRIPLEGEMSAKGTGAGSAAVATGLMALANPLTAWVGLFHRGNNAKIKAGEILAGFVREDVLLDLESGAPRRIQAAPPQPAVPEAPAPPAEIAQATP